MCVGGIGTKSAITSRKEIDSTFRAAIKISKFRLDTQFIDFWILAFLLGSVTCILCSFSLLQSDVM